ncbi:MAG: transcription elongation factor GreB [Gammaproteobacteria bacterium]|nr:transcription elongation factor GreB [Gammaproteobacteria bacterium]
MTRYRPPRERSSPYITPEGHARLTSELKDLWKIQRPALTARIQAAAANGDRSENGDYIYGRKALREMDSRIRYLSKRLDESEIIDRPPRDSRKIYFGATVTLEDEDGKTAQYRLVGADEIDTTLRWISIDSPLARALIGKQVDDEVTIQAPAGEQTWWVTRIGFEGSER